MELKEFVSNFAEQFDETDISEINAETVFQNLEEWSSLTAIGVIALAKTEFGKTITGGELRACTTVEDVYRLILSK